MPVDYVVNTTHRLKVLKKEKQKSFTVFKKRSENRLIKISNKDNSEGNFVCMYIQDNLYIRDKFLALSGSEEVKVGR